MGRVNPAPSPAVAPELTVADEDLGTDAPTVVRALADRLRAAGRIEDPDALVEVVLARETIGSTALPGGLAMPHARSESVTAPSVVAARLPEPVTWTDGSGPVRLVLLIAAPAEDAEGYLALLQQVASACVKKSFLDDAAGAAGSAELAEVLAQAVHQR